MDYWDMNNSSNSLISIDNDINWSMNLDKCCMAPMQNAFLSNIITNGKYSWKFKVVCIPKRRYYYSFIIGVFKYDSSKSLTKIKFFQIKHKLFF